MRWVSLFFLSLALVAFAADDLAGSYTCFSRDPRTLKYAAYVIDIAPRGEVYQLNWSWEGQPTYDGVGVVLNGRLCVGYAGPVGYGVSVYKIGTGGDLEGYSALPGNPALTLEKLHRRDSGAGGASND
jgi:hypothetical protein